MSAVAVRHSFGEGGSLGEGGSESEGGLDFFGIFGKCDAALRLGGTVSGEHGIGFSKARFLPAEMGEGAMNMMRAIKSALDPKGILNPGKMFE